MNGKCHSRKCRHGLALTSGSNKNYLVISIILHLLNVNQGILRNLNISKLTRSTDNINHASAFDSYFTVDMAEVDDNGLLLAEKSYRYGPEIASFFARFLLTFAVEMGIALLFGFREKKQLLLLLWVNGATQLILNVLLNIISYRSGMLAFVLSYILFELIVFAIEAVVYSVWLRRVSEKPKKVWVCVVYALVANAVSFVVGYNLALVIPSLF